MNRRHLLTASGLTLAGLAGCLDDAAPDPTADREGSDTSESAEGSQDQAEDQREDTGDDSDDHDVPTAARETGEATLDALARGEPAVAASYAPFDGAGPYERIWVPDAVRAIDFAGEADDETDTPDVFDDGTVETERRLEYDLELEAADHRYERRVGVTAVEIDGEWYAWYREPPSQPFRPPADAAVDVDRTDRKTVEITLLDRSEAMTVFVVPAEHEGTDGDSDEREPYALEEIGEARTLSTENEDVAGGTYEIRAAVRDPSEQGANTLQTVSIVDFAAWTDVTEITLEAQTSGWVGSKPDHIAAETNPPLVLEEGREYTITVENGDGSVHNFQLGDESEAVVDDYATDLIEDDDGTRELTVTATEELAEYVCAPHRITMRGDVVVVDSLDDDG
ncbi:cupredoxin domain-containing protein [Halobiforma nitratireducens]|uniref:Blue (Type 1) copper domain protein n=1 Tax=Halobiforma nitratireducens JCM 10879 TaxID=1227454 RepID=M0M4X5_9EURY|nr:plastocyanin/azurin family copper-binding protein [Halobiforma nitratireducens]EMA39674.1 blue (type 1) copper domain protein [Halobiforma nitratireducens JCM 10879]